MTALFLNAVPNWCIAFLLINVGVFKLFSGKVFFISALNLEMLLSRARSKEKPLRMPVTCG